jgi:hypothetical protein
MRSAILASSFALFTFGEPVVEPTSGRAGRALRKGSPARHPDHYKTAGHHNH